MDSKEEILKRLAAGRPDEAPYPETGFTPQRFDDPEAMFAERLGAVWIAQNIRHKALYFGATALMIVIPRDAIVATMHEAVLRPEVDDFGYGCFMSGPSKTADIEQALVFGAHGPMSVTVLLR